MILFSLGLLFLILTIPAATFLRLLARDRGFGLQEIIMWMTFQAAITMGLLYLMSLNERLSAGAVFATALLTLSETIFRAMRRYARS